MMKPYVNILLFILIGTLFSQNYDLKQYVISSSAFSSSNSQHRLNGTLGQSVTGKIQNDNHILSSGFWGYISYNFLGVDEPILPKEFFVSNSYPNPFNPKTMIDFAIPKASRINITIYDLLGREVLQWKEDFTRAGYYKFYWYGINNQGASVSSGTYLVIITDGEKRFQQKITLLK